jgi:hypothetical protein
MSATLPLATTNVVCVECIQVIRPLTHHLVANPHQPRIARYHGALGGIVHGSFALHSADGLDYVDDRLLAENDCHHDCYSRILTTITEMLSSAPSSSATDTNASVASRGIRPLTKSIISISWTSL